MPRGKRSEGFTQISISMPKALLEQIDEVRVEDNRSRSNWIVTELTAAVNAKRAGKTTQTPPTQFPRQNVPDAPLGSRRTGSPSISSINEDAPVEIPPINPARSPKMTKARAALRKMTKGEEKK